jgi:hypothetical protein
LSWTPANSYRQRRAFANIISLGAGAYIGGMSEIPPAEASGEAAAKLDAEAEADAKIDAEAEAAANLEPEAEGEL